jgi:hypothetical protein
MPYFILPHSLVNCLHKLNQLFLKSRMTKENLPPLTLSLRSDR